MFNKKKLIIPNFYKFYFLFYNKKKLNIIKLFCQIFNLKNLIISKNKTYFICILVNSSSIYLIKYLNNQLDPYLVISPFCKNKILFNIQKRLFPFKKFDLNKNFILLIKLILKYLVLIFLQLKLFRSFFKILQVDKKKC